MRVFPPAVPLVTVLLGVALHWLWPVGLGLAAPARYWAGGIVIAAAFLGLGLWPAMLMHRSGQSANPWKPTTAILERGPYRVTRNPMYLQIVVICLGLAVVLDNLWILLLTPLCAWALQRFVILPEEAYLARKFGAPYEAYRRRVRRWL